MRRSGSGKGRHDGFSLIELTIALAIFSTGLGGLSLLLMLAVQESTVSQVRNAAVVQAASLAEAIRLNAAGGEEYLSRPVKNDCLDGLVCDPAQMASAALFDWQQRLSQRIPGAVGLVCLDSTPLDGRPDETACDGAGGMVIKVLWQEPGGNGEPAIRDQRVVRRLPLL